MNRLCGLLPAAVDRSRAQRFFTSCGLSSGLISVTDVYVVLCACGEHDKPYMCLHSGPSTSYAQCNLYSMCSGNIQSSYYMTCGHNTTH